MQISDDEGILGLVDQLQKHRTVDVYVEISDVNHDKSIPYTLLSANETDVGVDVRKPDIEIDVELDVGEADEDNNGNDSGEDDEERLVDVPTNYNSDVDEEREAARVKVSKYVDWKKKIQGNDVERDESHNEDKEEREPVSNVECPTKNREELIKDEGEKIGGCQSDYIDSSDSGSYIDTSSGSNADDAQCKKSSGAKCYDPNANFEEFFLDLRFPDLRLFKNVSFPQGKNLSLNI